TAQEYRYMEYCLLTLGVVPFSPPPKTTILQNAQIINITIINIQKRIIIIPPVDTQLLPFKIQ
ncbi:hypothetical protein, partial [Alicyclobacillus suci]|uniref:hypothetical protein n=1 Tax=Alicyclobacillus suci TaxID=2816080 RepID=UPI001A8DCB56